MNHTRRQTVCGSRSSREGLTLYEVFLSLVILAAAMAVLSQHMGVGTRAGVSGQMRTQAALLCETKMAEVLAGVVPMTPVADLALATPQGATGWTWTLKVQTGLNAELLELVVKVMHTNAQGTMDTSFTLRRLVRNPAIYLQPASTATGTSTSTGSAGAGLQSTMGGL